MKNIGKNKEREVKKGHNGWYWLNKINTNIKSDAKVNYELFCKACQRTERKTGEKA